MQTDQNGTFVNIRFSVVSLDVQIHLPKLAYFVQESTTENKF